MLDNEIYFNIDIENLPFSLFLTSWISQTELNADQYRYLKLADLENLPLPKMIFSFSVSLPLPTGMSVCNIGYLRKGQMREADCKRCDWRLRVNVSYFSVIFIR